MASCCHGIYQSDLVLSQEIPVRKILEYQSGLVLPQDICQGEIRDT